MAILYKDLKSDRTETTESFFSDLFLRARIETGHESSKGYHPDIGGTEWDDELLKDDVNIYIIHALSLLFHPITLELMKKYAVSPHSDAGQVADSMKTRSEKFMLYRTNADFLLLNLGLFHGDLPFWAYLDKGATYYAAAAGYRREIDGGRSALVEVLEKLSIGFHEYVGLLRFMKCKHPNFFGIFKAISDREIKELEQIVDLEVRLRKTEEN